VQERRIVESAYSISVKPWLQLTERSLTILSVTCMSDCLFCKIISGEIPAKRVYEDEHTLAFEDINPQAPTHVLIIPKKHVRGLKEAQGEDADLIGRLHLAAAEIGRQRGIEDGYRTVLNVGPKSGQSVFHMHVHLIGGRDMKWPPG
jgi:histidine triad (HIT) family protein